VARVRPRGLLSLEPFGRERSRSTGPRRGDLRAALSSLRTLALESRLVVVFHELHFLPPGLEVRALYDVAPTAVSR
jgi:hypothetical protein